MPVTIAPAALPSNRQNRRLVLQDDIQFWSRQMREHALFLSLMLEDVALKAQAVRLQNLWRAVETGQDRNLPAALNEIILFKKVVLDRLMKGEWLGWALPAFVSHILFEAEFFRARVFHSTTAQQDLTAMVRIVKEHTQVAPKLLNPGQPSAETEAATLATRLAKLQSACSSSFFGECSSRQADLAQADTFFRVKVPQRLNIVHPVLLAHIVREGERARMIASMV